MWTKLIKSWFSVLLVVSVSFVSYDICNRELIIAKINDVYYNAERDEEMVKAVSQLQEYAAPAVQAVSSLVKLNEKLHSTVTEAAAKIHAQETELSSAKTALEDSVKLLQSQIDEKEMILKHVGILEKLLDKVMEKLPEADRVAYTKLKDKEPETLD
jgi:outer membrane protein TolC